MAVIHSQEVQAFKDGIGVSSAEQAKTAKAKSPSDELSTTASAVHRLYKAHEDGCDACGHSGYKGRIGIYQLLIMSEDPSHAVRRVSQGF